VVCARRMAVGLDMVCAVKRIERIRLYPSARQEQALRFMLDVTRQLYNAALQERRDAYRMRGVSVSVKQQYAELTVLRQPGFWLDSRLAAVYRECEDAVLHRLDLAMQAFFRRCKRGETPGFPRFKSAARWKQLTFPHGDRALRLVGARVRVPGVGAVRLRTGREVPAERGRAWIVEKNGRWYACMECERAAQPLPATGKVLGVDRGVHVLAATSEGELIRNGRLADQHRRVVTGSCASARGGHDQRRARPANESEGPQAHCGCAAIGASQGARSQRPTRCAAQSRTPDRGIGRRHRDGEAQPARHDAQCQGHTVRARPPRGGQERPESSAARCGLWNSSTSDWRKG
jgi:hypothetical protein